MVIQKPEIGLIDADLFCYDIPFACQAKDKETGELMVAPFSRCIRRLEGRLQGIREATGCTQFELYLTGKGNFRHEVAKILPYKGNRKSDRAYHYRNMMNYLQWAYGANLVQGMEADDALAIRQIELQDRSVIISRDKDLRMVPGWHYSWGVTNQPEKPLEHITELGYLTLTKKTKEVNGVEKHTYKLTGGGIRWFYAQCMMGDSTDNIQGIPRVRDVNAYKTLQECQNETELYEATLKAYQEHFIDEEVGYNSFKENARLLWMVRNLDENQMPVMWEMKS